MTDFDALTLEQLRQRQSVKWRRYPEDVLPLWVAESDVPLAPCVVDALTSAVRLGDTGYAEATGLGPAFAGFAHRHWGWELDPTWVWPVADVMTGVYEALRVLTAPGDGVVICPPVYHPFFEVPVIAGRRLVEVPLVAGSLDLQGISYALSAGATAVLLCSPHNPTGTVWSAELLDELDAVVRGHGAVVLSDEVHAPLTLAGATFSPYLGTGRHGVALVSASKAFNLAGMKAAMVVAGTPQTQALLATLPFDLRYRVGHFGALAGTAAYTSGDTWLAELNAHLGRLRTVLVDRLPAGIAFTPPQASYLAWLGFDEDRPAVRLLEEHRLALADGADFGAPRFARLNFGTTTEILTEALDRLVGKT